MTKRVVVACFGEEQSAGVIRRLAQASEVIAVALDFGGAVTLGAMREMALTAGAARCHALDVREEFARERLLPALHQRTAADPAALFAELAGAFTARKLDEIAALEHATVIAPESVPITPRPLLRAARDPLHVRIGFQDGMPVSINGVEMTLTELMESIETITGEPALTILDRALARVREKRFA